MFKTCEFLSMGIAFLVPSSWSAADVSVVAEVGEFAVVDFGPELVRAPLESDASHCY